MEAVLLVLVHEDVAEAGEGVEREPEVDLRAAVDGADEVRPGGLGLLVPEGEVAVHRLGARRLEGGYAG